MQLEIRSDLGLSAVGALHAALTAEHLTSGLFKCMLMRLQHAQRTSDLIHSDGAGFWQEGQADCNAQHPHHDAPTSWWV